MNERLMRKMGAEPKDGILLHQFVKFFDESLPGDEAQFSDIIAEFITCANAANRKKKLARAADKQMAQEDEAKRSPSKSPSKVPPLSLGGRNNARALSPSPLRPIECLLSQSGKFCLPLKTLLRSETCSSW